MRAAVTLLPVLVLGLLALVFWTWPETTNVAAGVAVEAVAVFGASYLRDRLA